MPSVRAQRGMGIWKHISVALLESKEIKNMTCLTLYFICPHYYNLKSFYQRKQSNNFNSEIKQMRNLESTVKLKNCQYV